MLADDEVIPRCNRRKLGKMQQRISRYFQKWRYVEHPVGNGGDLRAFRPGQNRFSNTIDVINHVPAYEHRLAVIEDEDRDDAAPHQSRHRAAVIILDDLFCKVDSLQRGNHALPEA